MPTSMPKISLSDDVHILKTEIENELAMKAMLQESIQELQHTATSLEKQINHLDSSEEDEWRIRYYTQLEVNEQLEQQRDWLREKAFAALNHSTEGISVLLADLDLDSLSEGQLMRYLRQLEKNRNALFNELRDTEWKLDQESKTFYKYNETRKAYMTEITDAMLNLEALRNKMKASEPGSIAKCPRQLKYINISPDHRVIDARKGPIKKTAAVRSLPKLEAEVEDEVVSSPKL